MKKSLTEILKDKNHITYIFIEQCTVQGFYETFKDEDRLKRNLLDKYDKNQSILINYESYSISQFYENQFV
jgi:hypothetical protein